MGLYIPKWVDKPNKVGFINELPAMLERRPYKTTTRFDGLTFYISGQTGMPKTDQSRHKILKPKQNGEFLLQMVRDKALKRFKLDSQFLLKKPRREKARIV